MNRIPQILDQKGWTKYRLAKATGMSHPTILKIVNAQVIPPHTTWNTIKKIANALDVDPRELETDEIN